MANAALFIGWGQVVRGRETSALQVFNDSQAYYARLQRDGAIESFETVVLQPHGGDLAGFTLVRGERNSLDALVANNEFQTLIVRANLIAENVGVVNGAIGTELTDGIGRFMQAIQSMNGVAV